MGIFVSRPRRTPTVDPGARWALPDEVRARLAHRFEAVAEVLASGSDSTGACQVVGRDLALDGTSLEEALAGLRHTWRSARGCDPAYDAVTALLVAWSDATLAYLHQISCDDPMTGLASLAHVRSRLSELYRGAQLDGLHTTHALVLCELVAPGTATTDSFTRAMHMARLGEAARTVFAGPETIGRLGSCRVVVVTPRHERLGARVRLLRTLVEGSDLGVHGVRTWIEGLPPTDAGAALLLDELARH